MYLVELAPRMGPARRQLYVAADAEPLEPRVTVDMYDALKPLQMASGPLGATIRA